MVSAPQVTNNLLVTICASHSVFSACWPRTSTLVGNANSIYTQTPSVVAHELSALPIGLGTTNGNTETHIRQGSADFSLALRSYLEASTLVARIRPAYYGRSSYHTPIEPSQLRPSSARQVLSLPAYGRYALEQICLHRLAPGSHYMALERHKRSDASARRLHRVYMGCTHPGYELLNHLGDAHAIKILCLPRRHHHLLPDLGRYHLPSL